MLKPHYVRRHRTAQASKCYPGVSSYPLRMKARLSRGVLCHWIPPKQQNSQVSSADRQHNGLDVPRFIDWCLNEFPTLCCNSLYYYLSLFLWWIEGFYRTLEHNVLDALKACCEAVSLHYWMYSLSSQRPLNVNGNDVKEQHDEITPLSHTAL